MASETIEKTDRRPGLRQRRVRALGSDITRIIPQSLRRLGWSLRRIFKKSEPQSVYEPDPQRLAEMVSRVPGSSWVWCGGCGAMMSPVVLGDDQHIRVVALGCTNCGVGLPVALGLLIGGEPASATVH